MTADATPTVADRVADAVLSKVFQGRRDNLRDHLTHVIGEALAAEASGPEAPKQAHGGLVRDLAAVLMQSRKLHGSGHDWFVCERDAYAIVTSEAFARALWTSFVRETIAELPPLSGRYNEKAVDYRENLIRSLADAAVPEHQGGERAPLRRTPKRHERHTSP